MKTTIKDSSINVDEKIHVLQFNLNEQNVGLFGSKIRKKQYSKIEDALNKKTINLPFGMKLLI